MYNKDRFYQVLFAAIWVDSVNTHFVQRRRPARESSKECGTYLIDSMFVLSQCHKHRHTAVRYS